MSPSVDLCTVPLGKAPDGTWDLVHVQSLETVTIAVSTSVTALALLVALPRLFVNRGKLLIADYFTILALVFVFANLIIISLGNQPRTNPPWEDIADPVTAARYSRHDWNFPACWADARYIKLQFCVLFFSGFVQFFPRAAIFLLYRQLFQVHSRSVRVAIRTGLVFTLLISAPIVVLAVIYLAPRPGEAWEQVLVRQSGSTTGYAYSLIAPVQRAGSVALDGFAFILPLPIITRLNLARGKRLQLRLLFSTALLGIGASIASLVIGVKQVQNIRGNPRDVMWLSGPSNVCPHAEYCIAIIVGSMPAFSTFLKLHVLQSRVSQALRSALGVGSSRSTHRLSDRGGSPARPLHGTIGSPAARKKRRGQYELTDTMILDSRYTVQGGEDGDDRTVQPGHILRTMDIRQSDHPRSTDNLV
ncbi:hypothetical protein PG991_015273 [Apiospora marii]|uniref:Rhodopsin domain-containing protein n=1 Tax=Apiospora marii TaxID=335849 RepID=A0ABR1R1B5_9PEZI